MLSVILLVEMLNVETFQSVRFVRNTRKSRLREDVLQKRQESANDKDKTEIGNYLL